MKLWLKIAAPKRYEYSIKKIADCEVIWSLVSDDGWVLVKDDEGHECAPVWPHSKYAEACAIGSWENTKPRAIDINDWIEKWLPGLEKDNKFIAVFPTPLLSASVVPPQQIKNDLLDELENYE